MSSFFFFFNDTATTEIYTLSLHDALPISSQVDIPRDYLVLFAAAPLVMVAVTLAGPLTVTDGLLLLGLFVLFVTYVAARELRRSIAVFRDVEVYEAAVAEDGDDAGSRRGAGTDVRQAPPVGAGARTGAERTQQVVEDAPRTEERDLPGWSHLGLAAGAPAGLAVGAGTGSNRTEGVLVGDGVEGAGVGGKIGK